MAQKKKMQYSSWDPKELQKRHLKRGYVLSFTLKTTRTLPKKCHNCSLCHMSDYCLLLETLSRTEFETKQAKNPHTVDGWVSIRNYNMDICCFTRGWVYVFYGLRSKTKLSQECAGPCSMDNDKPKEY